MNKILFKYLLSGFAKSLFTWILIFYAFGLILNLFEEIEFFKNTNSSSSITSFINCPLYTKYDSKIAALYYFYFKYVFFA